ncbi:MAG TPA: SURF1 family protein [Gemmatimonadaceae bacterium]|nr:SURF1 family protein [Gemmatimonadaceae bacterium]
MRLRSVIAVVVAVLVAAVCIRLGFWQLDRHGQRRALNQIAERQMTEPPARSIDELARDTAAARYRPVALTGTFDYDNEIVLAVRSHQGSPGVNLLTPFRVPGDEQVVLVNRGWVYAPDGVTVDLERWREAEEATIHGYAVPYSAPPPDGPGIVVQARSVRRLDHAWLAEHVPYPLAPLYVIDTTTARTAPGTPARLGGVALDAGPHLGYAGQWFLFAAIAVIGVGILVWRDRQPMPLAAVDEVASAGAAGNPRDGGLVRRHH